MSVRSHAPDCAKTVALNSGDYAGTVSCTCGAEYVRGVPTLEEAERLRAALVEAREGAEKWRDRAERGFDSWTTGLSGFPWEAGS